MAEPKSSVLFVCLGNICRSPSAEAVFKHKAALLGVDIRIDSAGTMGYHTGCPPDPRSIAAGEARGYSFAGLACRRVEEQDFIDFDYVVAMDKDNVTQLLKVCPEGLTHKVNLLMSFSDLEEEEVPDPYYGGKRGFEYVLDLIEHASDALLARIIKS